MKTSKLIVLTALLISTAIAFGQDGSRKENMKAKKEKIKAMKVAYITEKLELTPEESEKFWPIYHKYEAKRKEMHKVYKKKNDPSTPMSEEKADMLIKNGIEAKEKELEIHKAFIAEVKTVLASTKIVRLHKAEKEFKRVLLKKMKERREGGPHGPGPHGH